MVRAAILRSSVFFLGITLFSQGRALFADEYPSDPEVNKLISGSGEEARNPRIATFFGHLSEGIRLLVVWEVYNGKDWDIAGRIIRAPYQVPNISEQPVKNWKDGPVFTICSEEGDQKNPQIAVYEISDDKKAFAFVAWEDERDQEETGTDIYSAKIDINGKPMWPLSAPSYELPNVVADAPGNQTSPIIDFGKIVDGIPEHIFVVWTDSRKGDETDLYAQKITTDTGDPEWFQSQDFIDGVPVCTAAGDQRDPAFEYENFAGEYFYVVWNDSREQTSVGYDIYAAKIDVETGEMVTDTGLGTLSWKGSEDGLKINSGAEAFSKTNISFVKTSFSKGYFFVFWVNEGLNSIYYKNFDSFGFSSSNSLINIPSEMDDLQLIMNDSDSDGAPDLASFIDPGSLKVTRSDSFQQQRQLYFAWNSVSFDQKGQLKSVIYAAKGDVSTSTLVIR